MRLAERCWLPQMEKLLEAHFDFDAHPEVWQQSIACVAADGDHAKKQLFSWILCGSYEGPSF
jgi:hypothetical protein